MDPLQNIFALVKGTREPAAGSANELLVRLVRREDGFPFRSLEEARCHDNIRLLLDMQLAEWNPSQVLGVTLGGKIRLSESVKKTLLKT